MALTQEEMVSRLDTNMKNKSLLSAILLLFILLSRSVYATDQNDDQKITNFFAKDSVKILVTDSGLGGVSVAADIVSRMKNSGVFEYVQVIFFNAQPHEKSGYNSMKSTEQKIEVFNNALIAIEENFHPDLILIACNTLSVLYEYTEFASSAEYPVLGIVGTGVDLIKNKIYDNDDSKVLLFATETTVNQNKHIEGLIKVGISSERVIPQACPKLAGFIERDPESDTTISLVNKYVNSALEFIDEGDSSIYVSYNCTHYGYIDKIFRQVFSEKGINVKEFLNPNPLMADFIFDEKYLGRYKSTTVDIRIVSQPELTPGKIGAIYGLIEPISPETADALMEYEFEPNYFEWKSIVEGR